MDAKTVLSHVDHTLLKPEATEAQIKALCQEALEHNTASVCINPRYIPLAVSILQGKVPVCTVIGFPLGAMTTEAKVLEARDAVAKGADEIDMVISIGDLKDGKLESIEAEIRAVKEVVGNHILKVIIETCLLTDEEKRQMCHIVEKAGADYIKTSTGFSSGGATEADVSLFTKETQGRIKIKAAGGIKSYRDMLTFLSLGADRLGSSSAIRLMKEAGLL
ncbi:deoxyribose-phosphate aldolase [Oscillospiraceae bacterium LTW-04]|nr:deoxyribose-phosphate aldolase [Oscillospiraceae bacterium MB24-C1]